MAQGSNTSSQITSDIEALVAAAYGDNGVGAETANGLTQIPSQASAIQTAIIHAQVLKFGMEVRSTDTAPSKRELDQQDVQTVITTFLDDVIAYNELVLRYLDRQRASDNISIPKYNEKYAAIQKRLVALHELKADVSSHLEKKLAEICQAQTEGSDDVYYDANRVALFTEMQAYAKEYMMGTLEPQLADICFPGQTSFKEHQLRVFKKTGARSRTRKGQPALVNFTGSETSGDQNRRYFTVSVPIGCLTDEQLDQYGKTNSHAIALKDRVHTDSMYARERAMSAYSLESVGYVDEATGEVKVLGKPVIRHSSMVAENHTGTKVESYNATRRTVAEHITVASNLFFADHPELLAQAEHSAGSVSISIASDSLMSTLRKQFEHLDPMQQLLQIKVMQELFAAYNSKPLEVRVFNNDGSSRLVTVQPQINFMAIGVNSFRGDGSTVKGRIEKDPAQAVTNKRNFNALAEDYAAHIPTTVVQGVFDRNPNDEKHLVNFQHVSNLLGDLYSVNAEVEQARQAYQLKIQQASDRLFTALQDPTLSDAKLEALRHDLRNVLKAQHRHVERVLFKQRQASWLEQREEIYQHLDNIDTNFDSCSPEVKAMYTSLVQFCDFQDLVYTDAFRNIENNYWLNSLYADVASSIGYSADKGCRDGRDRTSASIDQCRAAAVARDKIGGRPLRHNNRQHRELLYKAQNDLLLHGTSATIVGTHQSPGNRGFNVQPADMPSDNVHFKNAELSTINAKKATMYKKVTPYRRVIKKDNSHLRRVRKNPGKTIVGLVTGVVLLAYIAVTNFLFGPNGIVTKAFRAVQRKMLEKVQSTIANANSGRTITANTSLSSLVASTDPSATTAVDSAQKPVEPVATGTYSDSSPSLASRVAEARGYGSILGKRSRQPCAGEELSAKKANKIGIKLSGGPGSTKG